jgi:hypothetical protein
MPSAKNLPCLRWVGVLAAAVLLPKCLLCLASYLAVGTGLMRAAPELCGAAEGAAVGEGTLALAVPVLLAVIWLRGGSGFVSIDRWFGCRVGASADLTREVAAFRQAQGPEPVERASSDPTLNLSKLPTTFSGETAG